MKGLTGSQPVWFDTLGWQTKPDKNIWSERTHRLAYNRYRHKGASKERDSALPGILNKMRCIFYSNGRSYVYI